MMNVLQPTPAAPLAAHLRKGITMLIISIIINIILVILLVYYGGEDLRYSARAVSHEVQNVWAYLIFRIKSRKVWDNFYAYRRSSQLFFIRIRPKRLSIDDFCSSYVFGENWRDKTILVMRDRIVPINEANAEDLQNAIGIFTKTGHRNERTGKSYTSLTLVIA